MKGAEKIVESRSHEERLLIYNDQTGEEEEVSLSHLLKQNSIDGIIRIQPDEWEALPTPPATLLHFNLAKTNHRSGERYALVKIIRAGHYRTDGTQKQPLLSIKEVLVGTCREVTHEVSYESLADSSFEESLPHIHDIRSLKETILTRYLSAYPHDDPQSILQKGVDMTKIHLETSTSLRPR